MNREEALNHFYENFVKAKAMEKMLKAEEFFLNNKDNLVSDFINSFKNICSKIKQMQDNNEKGKIGFITFSLLRTSIKEKKLTYLIDAFDQNWYFDRTECQALYEAGWLLGFLDELEAELEEKRKEYIRLLVGADIERVKYYEAGIYNQYVSNLARYAMPRILEQNEYKEILKEEKLEVRVGEYMDISEIVHKEDTSAKKSKDVKERILEKENKLFWYEVVRNLDLSRENYEGINFNYTDFTESDLSECSFNGCLLIGARLHKSILKMADLSYTNIHDADFSCSDLTGVSFLNADGGKGKIYNSKFRTRSIWGLNFEQANLENVSFEGADLECACFRGANLINVNFKGTNLKNAVFCKKDLHNLELDEFQRRSISIV